MSKPAAGTVMVRVHQKTYGPALIDAYYVGETAHFGPAYQVTVNGVPVATSFHTEFPAIAAARTLQAV